MKAKTKFLVYIFLLLLGFANVSESNAQCAMCKTSVESNQHEQKFIARQKAEGLNTGILYLMALPYIIFCVIGYFWYKNSKKESAEKLKLRSVIDRAIKN